jgi:NACalpha-BTF3-like transcription factor
MGTITQQPNSLFLRRNIMLSELASVLRGTVHNQVVASQKAPPIFPMATLEMAHENGLLKMAAAIFGNCVDINRPLDDIIPDTDQAKAKREMLLTPHWTPPLLPQDDGGFYHPTGDGLLAEVEATHHERLFLRRMVIENPTAVYRAALEQNYLFHDSTKEEKQRFWATLTNLLFGERGEIFIRPPKIVRHRGKTAADHQVRVDAKEKRIKKIMSSCQVGREEAIRILGRAKPQKGDKKARNNRK